MTDALPIWLIAIPFLIALSERFTTAPPAYGSSPVAASPPRRPSSLSDTGDVDLISLLEEQHDEIKALFSHTLAASGQDRARRFLALRQLLATHEALEERIVHPAAVRALRELGKAGHEIVRERLEEERTAATTIAELERLPIDSFQFEMGLRQLQHAVVEHAEHEERLEFAALERSKVRIASGELRRAAESASGGASSQQDEAVRDVVRFVAMVGLAREVLGAIESIEYAADASALRVVRITSS